MTFLQVTAQAGEKAKRKAALPPSGGKAAGRHLAASGRPD